MTASLEELLVLYFGPVSGMSQPTVNIDHSVGTDNVLCPYTECTPYLIVRYTAIPGPVTGLDIVTDPDWINAGPGISNVWLTGRKIDSQAQSWIA